MKVLVLGGYGNFGTRICRALVNDPAIRILVGGRDLGRAERFAQATGGHSRGVAVDLTAADFVSRLQEIGPELVIHAAGPFQQQGYVVANASAAVGAHYIDLADGRRFVCDFAENVDESFRKAGRFAVTGASTVPALSSAVVDHLCAGWSRIDTIDICIAPAQTAPRGRATLAAVLGYCGEPIAVWANGTWQARIGWGSPALVTFVRLRPRLAALCDIPDLELFPRRYAGVQEVMFRAALEVRASQRVFAILAALRSRRLAPRLDRFAGILNTLAKSLDAFGSGLGGMVVRVAGQDAEGRPTANAWHIAADHNHGPEIPCMAAIVLARQLAAGVAMPVGAQPCMGLLTLADFEPEFARWGMTTDIIRESAGSAATKI